MSFTFNDDRCHAHFPVKEVSEQNQELLRQAQEEEQAELCRKFEAIHEVHSIESLPLMRFNKFDDTKVSDRQGGCHFMFHTLVDLCVMVNPSLHVRLQAMNCWERCPWPS